MKNPETIEFLSFRRTFTLLIVLVVLPSAGLSGFGVVAIVNERAAVEKRLEAVWSTRLATVSGELRGALQRVKPDGDEGYRAEFGPDGLRLQVAGVSMCESRFHVDAGVVSTDDARLRTVVSSVSNEFGGLPELPVFFSVATPQGTHLVAAVRRDTAVLGCSIAPASVDQVLMKLGAAVTPSGEPATFSMVAVKRDSVEGVVARIVSGVSEVREAALGPRELAGLQLSVPLQDFRLVALAQGEDPVAQASARNRALYGVLLGLFYVTLAIGVVFTGRTLYREARLSRLKTDFVSLVSHELRTPLTSIRMFIEMLALGRVKDPQEMQTVLDLLSKETARLSSMIENVLDWARIESGKKTYRRELQQISGVVDAATSALKAQRVGAPFELSIDVAPGLPDVAVDRDALAGALLNLLQNAYKYSGEPKRIAVRARPDDEGVVVEVEDNGVGIPRREQKRIFDRFYRIDGLLTRETEGSGLGLSIAQRIVQAHGGRISLDSTPGTGSTFRIHLPKGAA